MDVGDNSQDVLKNNFVLDCDCLEKNKRVSVKTHLLTVQSMVSGQWQRV